MPIATTGEQRALRDSVDAAKGEWADLVRVGFFEVVREGGTVVDLAVMLERAAENLVPGPLLPTALVSVLFPDFDGIAGFGFSPHHVVGAAEATHLLLKDADGWMLVPREQVTVAEFAPVDLSRSLGSVRVDEPGEGADPYDLTAARGDLARLRGEPGADHPAPGVTRYASKTPSMLRRRFTVALRAWVSPTSRTNRFLTIGVVTWQRASRMLIPASANVRDRSSSSRR